MKYISIKLKTTVALILSISVLTSLIACNQPVSETVSDSQEDEVITNPLIASEEESGAEPVSGHWEETDITPEGVGYILCSPEKMADGSLVFYGKEDVTEGVLTRYTSTDNGISWTAQELDWEEKVGGQITTMTGVAGTDFVVNSLIIDDNDDFVEMSFWKIENGEATRLQSLDDADIYTMNMFDEETLFASGVTTAGPGTDVNRLINLTTDTVISEVTGLSEVTGGGIMGAAVDQSDTEAPRLYYIEFSEDGQVLSAVNKDGTVDKHLITLMSSWGDGDTDENGNYYYCNGGSICRIIKEGYVKEEVMEDAGFQLGLSNYFCNDMSYIDPTVFLCVLSNMSDASGKQLLMKYEWSTKPQAKPDVRISVWSLYENALIRAAVVEFSKDNPGVKVDYEVGMEDENAVETDVIQNLNVRLVAGKGPDILILDDLDQENYQKKGYLSDISDVIDVSLYQQNIVEPFILESGECYMVPARFSAPVLMGDAGDVTGLTTLDSLQEAILSCAPRPGDDLTKEAYYEEWSESERYALGFYSLDQLVDFTLKTSAPALIEDGEISRDNLLRVMSFINEVGSHYQMNRYPKDALSNSVYCSSDDSDPIMLEDGGYEYSVTKHAKYGWGMLDTPNFFTEGRRSKMDDTIKSDIICCPGLVEKAYKPLTVLSVTANSKETDTAKQFLATVMSESLQTMCYGDGNPILKSALTKRIDKHRERISALGYDGDVQAFYDSLKTPVIITGTTEVLRDCIVTHAQAMVNGEETPESAVDGIMDDLKIYLAEQG